MVVKDMLRSASQHKARAGCGGGGFSWPSTPNRANHYPPSLGEQNDNVSMVIETGKVRRVVYYLVDALFSVGFIGSTLDASLSQIRCQIRRNFANRQNPIVAIFPWWQLWSVSRSFKASRVMEKAPFLRTFQNWSESGGSKVVSPDVGNRTGSPHRWGAWRCKYRRAESTMFSLVMLNASVISPCCSIEIIWNQINLMTNHCGTDCDDEHLRNNSFLGINRKCAIFTRSKPSTPLSGVRRNDVREKTLCIILDFSPWLELVNRIWCHEGRFIWRQLWVMMCPCCRESRIPPSG